MPAYTLVISNGTDTFTFDGSTHYMPTVKVHLAYERNTDVVPSVLTAEIETWDLRNFVYIGTPTGAQTDLETLAAILRNKTTPIVSAILKYDGNAVRTLSTAAATPAGSHVDLYAQELDTPEDEPGQWVNHWSGSLVLVARRLQATSSVIRLSQKLEDAYDVGGLHTQTLSGEVEVSPGVDVETHVRANYVLSSLGSDYAFLTGGASHATGVANVDVIVLNRPSNTKASFRSVQTQRGRAIPATAKDFTDRKSIADGPGGRITTYHVVARGTTVARARTAARTLKPSAGVQVTSEEEDNDAHAVTATYTVRAPLPVQSAFYGVPSAITVVRRVSIRGGGQARIFDPVPGYDPYETLGARMTVKVTERIEMRCTSVVSPADVPLPEPLFADAFLQPMECDEDPPWRVEKAEKDEADLWSRSATRVYEFATGDEIDIGAMFQKIARPQGFGAALDLDRWKGPPS
mgnify:CR=1 FL=1